MIRVSSTLSDTFNSTELRMINVEMQPVLPVGGPPLDVVRREVRPAREAARQGDLRRQNAQGIAFCVHAQRAEPPSQLWEIPEGNESRVLLHCV